MYLSWVVIIILAYFIYRAGKNDGRRELENDIEALRDRIEELEGEEDDDYDYDEE